MKHFKQGVCSALILVVSGASFATVFDPAESKDIMCVIVAETAKSVEEKIELSDTTQGERLKAKASAVSSKHLQKFMDDKRFDKKYTAEEFSEGLAKGINKETLKVKSSSDKLFVGAKGKALDKSILASRISKYFEERYRTYKCSE